ncbi:MAG: hypothetical protein IPH28_06010 [Cytophagaceae bacterium]|nr:hypothetical protein [Cytophagaceae bacterium]
MPIERLREEFKDFENEISISIIKNEKYIKSNGETFFNQFIRDLWESLVSNFEQKVSLNPKR